MRRIAAIIYAWASRFQHQLADWPKFRWDRARIAGPLVPVSRQQGRLAGHMEALGFQLRQEAILQTLAADVTKTSEIEGEKLDADQVRSSIARRLGMDFAALQPADRGVEGIVEMMLDATRNFEQPLTGAAVRLACCALSHGPQRHEQNRGGNVAR